MSIFEFDELTLFKKLSMPILSRDKNQLTYIYNSNTQLGKQVLAYAQACDKKFHAIDISKDTLGDSIWTELMKNLGIPFSEIFDKDHPDAENLDISSDLDTDSWLKVINKNPSLLQKPIVVNGKKVMIVSSRSEILKFFGVDSAGLEKGFGHENPTISSTTDNEEFI